MRTPEKMNPAFHAFPEEVIQKIANILGGVARQQSRAGKYILVLQAKWRQRSLVEAGESQKKL